MSTNALEKIEMPHIKRLFMLLHGMYGNQLLDKYRTGKVNEKKEDTGLLSAQAVWLNGLQDFDFEVIRMAAHKCGERYKTFPPTLPEFQDLCKALAPRQGRAPADMPRLEMSADLKETIRFRNQKVLEELKLQRLGVRDYGKGLQPLLTMLAKAVGDAGGDEVRALRKLETDFKPRTLASR